MDTEQLANILWDLLSERFKGAEDVTIVPDMYDRGDFAVELKLNGKVFLFTIEDTTELQ